MADVADLHIHTDLTADLRDHLEAVSTVTGLALYDVFRDWLDLSLLAFERNDPEYLEIVEQYEDRHDEATARECLDHYAAALGELTAATAEVGHDVLGLVYEQLGLTSDAFAQHFTPHNVSDAMAAMTVVSDGFEDVDPPLTVHDPACGSGRLLVSAARAVAEADDAPPAVFYGRDKSATCAKLTAVNLTLLGIAGVAVVGDSLTMEERTVWKVVPGGSPPIRRNPGLDLPDEGQADLTAYADGGSP